MQLSAAAARCALVALAGLVVAALGDYTLHLDDQGLRILATLAVAAVAVWAIVRYFVPALRARMTDVDVALHIERRHPELRDRLAAAVEFLSQPETTAYGGSPALRRAVVAATTDAAQQLPTAGVVNTRPMRRAAYGLFGAIAVVAALVLLDPMGARIAAARLFNPWSDTAWPQRTHLEFRESVTQVFQGAPLELEVIDARDAELPPEVFLEWRYLTPGDEGPLERVRMQARESSATYHFDSLTRPLVYRAVGGDDDSMSWTRLDVVVAPAVQSLAARLEFPAYTGWQPQTVRGPIRALRDTNVVLLGKSTKPLASAQLHFESGQKLIGQIDEDSLGFELPARDQPLLIVDASTSFSIVLEDQDGYVGGDQARYELRAIEDSPPSVNIEQPATNLYVTGQADVPLSIVARDDLAIAKIELCVLRSDRSEHGIVKTVLFAGPLSIAPHPAPQDFTSAGDRRALDHVWALAPLELTPGTQLAFHVSAADYLPQTGESAPRRITIITAEEFRDRIAARQGHVLGQLAQALDHQRQARARIAEIEIQLDQVGTLEQQHVDQMQVGELAQRQVERMLADESDGAAAQLRQLLAELEHNHISSPDLQRQLGWLLSQVEQMAREPLPAIRRELTEALKQAQSALDAGDQAPDEVSSLLATTGQQQNEVVESLENLIDELARWDHYRRFARELTQIQDEQQQLADATAQQAQRLLSRAAREPDAQAQADLDKLSAQQHELARRVDRILSGMANMRDQIAAEQGDAANSLADALHEAGRLALSGRMREVAGQVARNQIGQAPAAQRQLAEDVEELINVLSNRPERELSRLVEKLRQAESDLADLQQQQQGLRRKMAAAAEIEDPQEQRRELMRLAAEEQALQEQVAALARRVERLQAEQAGRTLRGAARQMGESGAAGNSGDGQQAADAADNAARDLEEAQQQLARRRRQAEMDLAFEQLAQMADALSALRDQQVNVVDETIRLDELRRSQGHLSRAQTISLRNLARMQAGLSREAHNLEQKLSAAAVFRLALSRAGREMERAAEQLTAEQTGADTQQTERQALTRLEQLLASLEPESGEESEGGQGGEQQGEAQGQPPADGIPAVAQLKMLKMMQEDVNQRTQRLAAQQHRQGEWTPEMQSQLADLREEQGILADLAWDLSQPEAVAPEDDLDNLPDVFDQPAGDPSPAELRR